MFPTLSRLRRGALPSLCTLFLAGALAQAETPPPTPRPRPQATLEEAARVAEVVRQQLVHDVDQRLQAAADLVNDKRPEAALNALRLAQTVVRSATDVAADVRDAL